MIKLLLLLILLVFTACSEKYHIASKKQISELYKTKDIVSRNFLKKTVKYDNNKKDILSEKIFYWLENTISEDDRNIKLVHNEINGAFDLHIKFYVIFGKSTPIQINTKIIVKDNEAKFIFKDYLINIDEFKLIPFNWQYIIVNNHLKYMLKEMHEDIIYELK
jgi:hypothetical protein